MRAEVRPLCVELLLRLMANRLPTFDDDGLVMPLKVPVDWEEKLADLVAVEEGEAAEESWLGEADPLGGASFFEATPQARLRLLHALAERRLYDSNVPTDPLGEPPAGPGAVASAAWHGAPLGTDATGVRYWALPGEPRVWCEKPAGPKGGEDQWSVAATTTAEVRALAAKLSQAGGSASLCSALLKSLLPPVLRAEAERAAEAGREAERARRAEEAAAAARIVGGPRVSLRNSTVEETQRRAAERAAEEARIIALQTAEAAAAVDFKRNALKALVPERFHNAKWEAELYAAAELAERPDAPPTAEAPQGLACIGRSVSILWPKENAFFVGTITAFTPSTGMHTIKYEDGDVTRNKCVPAASSRRVCAC